MSNGLGAGFAAISLLAVLAGLALLVVLATMGSYVFYRRTGHVPPVLRYLVVAIGVGVLAVTGFSILALFDEAPAVAWLFTSIALVPVLVESVYLERTTELGRLDIVVTTVMAWGLPFFLGVGVVFGVMSGITSILDLAPGESRQLAIAWLASTVGGISIVLGMIPLGNRLGVMSSPITDTRERV